MIFETDYRTPIHTLVLLGVYLGQGTSTVRDLGRIKGSSFDRQNFRRLPTALNMHPAFAHKHPAFPLPSSMNNDLDAINQIDNHVAWPSSQHFLLVSPR